MKMRAYYVFLAAFIVVFVTAMQPRQPWRWAWVCAGVVLLLLTYLASKKYNSDFSVIVGQTEKHEIRFRRSEWTGGTRIAVDGEMKLHKIQSPSFRKFKKYDLIVGTDERHDVAFLIGRGVFAANRKRSIQVLVDGRAVPGL